MSQLSLMNFTKNTLKGRACLFTYIVYIIGITVYSILANQSRDRHNLSEEELEVCMDVSQKVAY